MFSPILPKGENPFRISTQPTFRQRAQERQAAADSLADWAQIPQKIARDLLSPKSDQRGVASPSPIVTERVRQKPCMNTLRLKQFMEAVQGAGYEFNHLEWEREDVER